VINLNNAWLKAVMSLGKNINLFGRRKRNNMGVFLASLIGLGVSAAAYQFGKNQTGNKSNRLQTMLSNFRKGKNTLTPSAAGMAEIAQELIPENGPSVKQKH
jgi:hypothetical protein